MLCGDSRLDRLIEKCSQRLTPGLPHTPRPLYLFCTRNGAFRPRSGEKQEFEIAVQCPYVHVLSIDDGIIHSLIERVLLVQQYNQLPSAGLGYKEARLIQALMFNSVDK